MGLFDSFAKQALGGLLGGSSNGNGLDLGSLMGLFANQGKVAESVSGLLAESGGLNGLLEKFQASGLGETAASWVGTGANQDISPDQLRSALGNETIEHFASKMGLQGGQIMPLLAQFLPVIIDQLTPSGAIDDNKPSADRLQQTLTAVIQRVMSGK